MKTKELVLSYEKLVEDLETAINRVYKEMVRGHDYVYHIEEIEWGEDSECLQVYLERYIYCESEYLSITIPNDVLEMAEEVPAEFIEQIAFYLAAKREAEKRIKQEKREREEKEKKKRQKEAAEEHDQKEYKRLKEKYDG
jgi:hypothetical protein